MPKKYSKSRRPMRKRRSYKKRSGKFARKQQQSALTYVKKKYTKVFVMEPRGSTDVYERTISLIGAKNLQNQLQTISLADMDQDTQLATDAKLYQFFRISGVSIKYIFPMPTNVDNTPVQWVSAYSAADVVAPTLPSERLQTLAAYQTSSCSQTKPITRYYNTSAALKRFGIQYCDTSELLAGNFTGAGPTYGASLLQDQGSSVNCKIFRASSPVGPTTFPIGRLQVTYYITYKGNKGLSSLTVV